MSSGAIRVRRLAGFFIVAAFATGRGPSADEVLTGVRLGLVRVPFEGERHGE
jgi:hypothetical protein